MPRNKYPEQTIDKILASATRLFMEKGYENTTIQDIINDLGDLTKGAIYHHFKGKEEILLEVCNRMFIVQERLLKDIRNDQRLTGLEKLRKLLAVSITESGQGELFSAAPDVKNNPYMFVRMVTEAVEISAPDFIQPILEEGIRDGSIKVKHPEEFAEIFMLLANIWANPLVFNSSREKFIRKLHYLNYLITQLGVPDLIEQSFFDTLDTYFDLYQSKRNK